MSTYSEQIDNVLQTHLLPRMRALAIEVAKYEPFSYTSTTLEERRRQLDYCSMLYDFLVEYRDGNEELTSAKLMNIVRLLEAPTREQKMCNLFHIKPKDAVVSGFLCYINDVLVTDQTILTPGDIITIKIVYKSVGRNVGTKSIEVSLQNVFYTSEGWEIVIPDFEVPSSLGGLTLDINTLIFLNATTISSESLSIPIAYTMDRPYYYGSGAPGWAAADIQDLSYYNGPKASKTFTFNPDSEVFYFAYPVAFGALTSILDPNGFDMISDFIVTTKSFTLAAPNPPGVHSYYVYEYDLPTIQTNFNITFNF